ncbi:MAG: radical SAM protein [Desulfobulbaceae bacterium]|nr:radical SAM protein [Desulfobulbaceae bacterium]
MLNASIENIQPLYKSATLPFFLSAVEKFSTESLPLLLQETNNLHYSQLLLLKITNLLVLKYQFLHRHEHLLARPFGLLVDPSNSCPLRCPGCLHNTYFRQHKNIIDWPDGLLSLDTFKLFLKQYAPYALYMHFFNWGEPLLNKNTPQFIKMAKGFCLDTVLSSNLNVKFNADDLVHSGLDFLIMSVDGATQETYQRYRQGGDLELVISNIKKLVAAKKKYNMQSPRLLWQFLTFEHNVSEIPLAKEMAQNLGVDVITFNEPYDVSWGDPSLAADNKHLEKTIFSEYTPDTQNVARTIESIESNSSHIEKCYNQNWHTADGKDNSPLTVTHGNRCPWLYKNLVMDALGRILPCCYVPEKSDKYDYIFSTVTPTNHQDHFNTDCFIEARKKIIGSQTTGAPYHDEKIPYCMDCNNRKVANIDTDNFSKYFNKYNSAHSFKPLLSETSINLLANWSN